MPVTVNGTNGLTFNDGTSQRTAASGFGFKNRIINGDMRIDQRNNGAAINGIADFTMTIDRWLFQGAAGKFNVQRNAGSVTPPAGFTNYLGVTVVSSVAPTGSDYFRIQQRIEGFNIADLNWGSSSAQPVTLSFWVRSSLTGAFGGALQNGSQVRAYPFAYTVNSANTWEFKTITIPGDTTGTWLNDNGLGLVVGFSLGTSFTASVNTWGGGGAQAPTGSQYVVSTSGATFYITGVQLEKGSTATSFDYRPYRTELALCKPYACFNLAGAGYSTSTTTFSVLLSPEVEMRATPSVRIVDGNSALLDYNVATRNVTAVTNLLTTNLGGELNFTCATTTASKPHGIRPKVVLFEAEL